MGVFSCQTTFLRGTTMGQYSSRFTDIIVKTIPEQLSSEQRSLSRSTRDKSTKVKNYDVLIYTELDKFTQSNVILPSNQPELLAGLPLASKEKLTIDWNLYEEYLNNFLEGEKLAHFMRSRLIETMSDGLAKLFDNNSPDELQKRVWWSNDASELDDLPWELTAYSTRDPSSVTFSFVRGMPPESLPPLLPVGDKLRLALIFDPSNRPSELIEKLSNVLSLEVVIIESPASLKEAIKKVSKEGYELLHIVTDGIVSLAHDGILIYPNDSDDPDKSEQISSYKLSNLLRGSRVRVLGLTPPIRANTHLSGVEIKGHQMPSIYRAFTYLCYDDVLLPSSVSPLGPIDMSILVDFWQVFYTKLVERHSAEEAIAEARSVSRFIPMALFLRQTQGKLFKKQTQEGATRGLESNIPTSEGAVPNETYAELEISKSLLEKLEILQSTYGVLPEGLSEFIEQEGDHQSKLEKDLEQWRNLEVDE